MTSNRSPFPTMHGTLQAWLRWVAGAVIVVALAGCGQAPSHSAGDAMTLGHDRGDVTFARTMMARDGQAAMMEGWAAGRASGAPVRAMAARMLRLQGGWDRALQACITRWAGSPPQGMMGSRGRGRMMGTHQMAGMMNERALRSLKAASGQAFDRRYLGMMVRHHTSMIALATAEAGHSNDPTAVRLAHEMRRTQTRELAALRRLLRPLTLSSR